MIFQYVWVYIHYDTHFISLQMRNSSLMAVSIMLNTRTHRLCLYLEIPWENSFWKRASRLRRRDYFLGWHIWNSLQFPIRVVATQRNTHLLLLLAWLWRRWWWCWWWYYWRWCFVSHVKTTKFNCTWNFRWEFRLLCLLFHFATGMFLSFEFFFFMFHTLSYSLCLCVSLSIYIFRRSIHFIS